MAFDACMMRAVLSEFSGSFPEGKIEKILQPVSDEIALVLHHGKSGGRLVFNVGPNAPRLQLSDVAKENPKAAPMFCMFLRKRLSGAKITGVRQPGFDRIAEFSVSGYDDMGFPTEMLIVCEIMGKYANFILLDGERKIISALKIIDFAASTVRQVLPGMKYQPPVMPEGKIPPTEMTEEELRRRLSDAQAGRSVEKFITTVYSGVATQIAHELTFRATGNIDTPLEEANREELIRVLLEWQSLLCREDYAPTVAIDRNGKPCDYSYMDITYLSDSCEYRRFDSFRELFDMYYAERDRLEKIHQRAKDIKTLLSNTKARTERKLTIQREALLESAKGEEYKKLGDLITANIYKLKRGDEVLFATDYYSDGCPEIRISLDSRLSGAANAQRMYKLYAKCKKASEVLVDQIALWESELKYLDSVSAFLESAECEQDIIDIRDELYKAGYGSRMKGYRPTKSSSSKPHKFVTSGGFTLLVGKNNTQNDYLTFKMAEKGDLWFHVKDLPGSHVIMITDGAEPSERDYTEAAEIAAGYSKATADLVAVDYTRVKNVKKPAGSKPGFVIYKTNFTAYVRPRKEIDGK